QRGRRSAPCSITRSRAGAPSTERSPRATGCSTATGGAAPCRAAPRCRTCTTTTSASAPRRGRTPWRTASRSARSTTCGACLRLAETLDQHRELLAAVAPDGVGLPETSAEQRRETRQDPVAHGVAVLVVDLLEMVDVDHHPRQRPARVAPRLREGGVGLLEER